MTFRHMDTRYFSQLSVSFINDILYIIAYEQYACYLKYLLHKKEFSL